LPTPSLPPSPGEEGEKQEESILEAPDPSLPPPRGGGGENTKRKTSSGGGGGGGPVLQSRRSDRPIRGRLVRAYLVFLVLLAVKVLARIFYRVDMRLIGGVPPDPWRRVR